MIICIIVIDNKLTFHKTIILNNFCYLIPITHQTTKIIFFLNFQENVKFGSKNQLCLKYYLDAFITCDKIYLIIKNISNIKNY